MKIIALKDTYMGYLPETRQNNLKRIINMYQNNLKFLDKDHLISNKVHKKVVHSF